MKVPRDISHDEIVIGMLKADPDFANEYLATALEEVDLPGPEAQREPNHQDLFGRCPWRWPALGG